MRKITTFLTFKDRGEEAVTFYVSVFKNSSIMSMVRYQPEGPGSSDALLHAAFQLNGQDFMAMDGGPHFTFTEGTSLFVDCETQEEVDHLWERLSEGGEKQRCGWLKGQIRRVMADHSIRPGRDDARQGPREIEKGHGSHAQDGQDRHQDLEAGVRPRIRGPEGGASIQSNVGPSARCWVWPNPRTSRLGGPRRLPKACDAFPQAVGV